MLVDGGAAVNLMPYTMPRKIGKSDEDLTQTDMMLVDFEGNVSPAQGAICVELTIGSKTLPTAFFVIKGSGSYNLLLGRDWIHANCCILSTMHHSMDQRLSGGGTRRNLFDSKSHIRSGELHIWKSVGYQVSQSVRFWTKAGSSSRL
jgi:hypothetical protein